MNYEEAVWLMNEVKQMGVGFTPKNMRKFEARQADSTSIGIKFLEPSDTVIEDQTIVSIVGVRIVMRTDRYPENPFDGDLVVNNTDLGAYENFEYQVENLTPGVKYYFGAYPYTSGDVYNLSNATSNRSEVLFKDGETVTITSVVDEPTLFPYANIIVHDVTAGTEQSAHVNANDSVPFKVPIYHEYYVSSDPVTDFSYPQDTEHFIAVGDGERALTFDYLYAKNIIDVTVTADSDAGLFSTMEIAVTVHNVTDSTEETKTKTGGGSYRFPAENGKEYYVSYGAAPGYGTPEDSEHFTVIKDVVKEVAAQYTYNVETVTVTVTMENQPEGASAIGQVITLYNVTDDIRDSKTWEGTPLTFFALDGKDYVISPSDKEDYTHSSSIYYFEAKAGASRNITVTYSYNVCNVDVLLTTDAADKTILNGTKVVFYVGSNIGDIFTPSENVEPETKIWDGKTLKFKVVPKTGIDRYYIMIDDIDNPHLNGYKQGGPFDISDDAISKGKKIIAPDTQLITVSYKYANQYANVFLHYDERPTGIEGGENLVSVRPSITIVDEYGIKTTTPNLPIFRKYVRIDSLIGNTIIIRPDKDEYSTANLKRTYEIASTQRGVFMSHVFAYVFFTKFEEKMENATTVFKSLDLAWLSKKNVITDAFIHKSDAVIKYARIFWFYYYVYPDVYSRNYTYSMFSIKYKKEDAPFVFYTPAGFNCSITTGLCEDDEKDYIASEPVTHVLNADTYETEIHFYELESYSYSEPYSIQQLSSISYSGKAEKYLEVGDIITMHAINDTYKMKIVDFNHYTPIGIYTPDGEHKGVTLMPVEKVYDDKSIRFYTSSSASVYYGDTFYIKDTIGYVIGENTSNQYRPSNILGGDVYSCLKPFNYKVARYNSDGSLKDVLWFIDRVVPPSASELSDLYQNEGERLAGIVSSDDRIIGVTSSSSKEYWTRSKEPNTLSHSVYITKSGSMSHGAMNLLKYIGFLVCV